MKLALMYSDPSSPVGLRRTRHILSVIYIQVHIHVNYITHILIWCQLTWKTVSIAILAAVEVLTSVSVVFILGLAAHLIQQLHHVTMWRCVREKRGREGGDDGMRNTYVHR